MKMYYPTINLLRGIAAFLVCLFHFTNYSDSNGVLFSSASLIPTFGKFGVNGVYIFFVISGFVIFLSLSTAKFQLNQLHRFLFRRFIRIELPYLASILLLLFVGFLFASKNHVAYTFSITQLLYHILYVIPFSSYPWYNIIYWTLAIEFQFYIVIALLYFFLSSKNNFTQYTIMFVFVASGFIVTDNRFVFHYATIFLQGILLALIKTEKIKFNTGMPLIIINAIATAYLHSIEIAIFSFLTVLVIHYVEINNKATNRFGELSYSLYLTHGLIGGNLLYLFSRYTTSTSEGMVLLIAALITSLLFSYLFWKLVEQPASRLSKRVKVALPAAIKLPE